MVNADQLFIHIMAININYNFSQPNNICTTILELFVCVLYVCVCVACVC